MTVSETSKAENEESKTKNQKEDSIPGKDFMEAKNITDNDNLKKPMNEKCMNNLDTNKNGLARYDSSSGFTDPDSGCAKSEVSSSSENDSKLCDQKDVDEELAIKDVEAGEMPAEEEEMLEDMPVDWSIVACSVIFGLGLATVLLYFSIRNLVRAQQLIGPISSSDWSSQGSAKGGSRLDSLNLPLGGGHALGGPGGLGGLGGLGGFGRSKRHLEEDEEDYEERVLLDSLKYRLGLTEEEQQENITEILKEKYMNLPPIERDRISLWLRARSQRRQMRLERSMSDNVIDHEMEAEHKHNQYDSEEGHFEPKLIPHSTNQSEVNPPRVDGDQSLQTGKAGTTQNPVEQDSTTRGSLKMYEHGSAASKSDIEKTSEKNKTTSFRDSTMQNQTSASDKILENFLELPTTWTTPTVELNSDASSSQASPTTTQHKKPSATSQGPAGLGGLVGLGRLG